VYCSRWPRGGSRELTELMTDSKKQRVNSREQRVESREQRTEQRIETKEHGVECCEIIIMGFTLNCIALLDDRPANGMQQRAQSRELTVED
jgi:hypothetical protein